jgi:hypothetical protein
MGTLKMAASRSTSHLVNRRCRALPRPSAAQTVEMVGPAQQFAELGLSQFLVQAEG